MVLAFLEEGAKLGIIIKKKMSRRSPERKGYAPHAFSYSTA